MNDNLDLSPLTLRFQKENLNVHGVVILQHGKQHAFCMLSEDIRRLQHSVSKSFTSMAVGLAIQEGKLKLSTTLDDLFPQYAFIQPDVMPDYKPGSLSVGNLLHMSSGHHQALLSMEERGALEEKDWVRYYLSKPLDRLPGHVFTYSSGDSYMLSAMVETAVGQTVRDYLVPRLFDPLGISDIHWDCCPLGRTIGCTGLYLTVEELSRFGQLVLQQGVWNEQQLIPGQWIDYVTRKHIDTPGIRDSGAGYGGQFWIYTHQAVAADGAHGQFCVILPDKQAVIAINSDEDRMQDIMDVIWEEIWPLL